MLKILVSELFHVLKIIENLKELLFMWITSMTITIKVQDKTFKKY